MVDIERDLDGAFISAPHEKAVANPELAPNRVDRLDLLLEGGFRLVSDADNLQSRPAVGIVEIDQVIADGDLTMWAAGEPEIQ